MHYWFEELKKTKIIINEAFPNEDFQITKHPLNSTATLDMGVGNKTTEILFPNKKISGADLIFHKKTERENTDEFSEIDSSNSSAEDRDFGEGTVKFRRLIQWKIILSNDWCVNT